MKHLGKTSCNGRSCSKFLSGLTDFNVLYFLMALRIVRSGGAFNCRIGC